MTRLPGALIEALDDDPALALLLDEQGVIVHLNRAWEEQARSLPHPERVNRDRLLGTKWVDGVRGPERAIYERLFASALALEPHPGLSVQQYAECNLASRVRVMRTCLAPMRAEGGPRFIVVVYELLDRGPTRAIEGRLQDYVNEHGFLTQCGCCRRARRPNTETWDFVPDLFDLPGVDVSHGLCRTCLETYYADDAA